MSKDFNFQVTGGENTLKAHFDLETGDNYVEQDIDHFKEAAKLEREKQEHFGLKDRGYRKMATIPDIVALRIMVDHHLDIHDPSFMSDPNNLKRLKQILMTEYRDLVINN